MWGSVVERGVAINVHRERTVTIQVTKEVRHTAENKFGSKFMKNYIMKGSSHKHAYTCMHMYMYMYVSPPTL